MGAVLENGSLFQGISVMPAASLWRFRNGVIKHKGTYFSPGEWEGQSTLDPDTYYRELREAFSENLPRYFVGQQRVAMSLTGGLDTRAVMAWYKGPRAHCRATRLEERIATAAMLWLHAGWLEHAASRTR